MPIFKLIDGKLKKLSLNGFSKEKSLQNLIEENLFETLDIHFPASEYPTTFGGRIDTLAVDSKGAPVIIEYKLNKNENVINQALSYLRWLKAQKVEFFEMLVIKNLSKEISKNLKIDWKNPRVICIAENYSKFDIDTVEVIPMRLELFQYRFYEDGILNLDPVNVPNPSSRVDAVPKVAIDQKNDLKDDLPDKSNQYINELYLDMRSQILLIDENIVEKPTRAYTAFRLGKYFAEIYKQRTKIRIILRPANYIDPKGKTKKVPDTHKWTLNTEVILSNKEDLEYVVGLIEQSYKDVL